jgi:hypothetical protein
MKSRRHVYQIGGAVLLLGVILASLLRSPSVLSTESLERPAASIAQVRLVDQQYSRLAAVGSLPAWVWATCTDWKRPARQAVPARIWGTCIATKPWPALLGREVLTVRAEEPGFFD